MAHNTLNTAIDAARQASLAAKSVQHDLGRVSELTKDDRSPVTVADFAAQAIVASVIRDADPSTPWSVKRPVPCSANLKMTPYLAW